MSSETLPDVNDVEEWLNGHYNDVLSIYPSTSKVKITNGSAAYYVNIYFFSDAFVLSGEIYGEVIRKECALEKDALLTTLDEII